MTTLTRESILAEIEEIQMWFVSTPPGYNQEGWEARGRRLDQLNDWLELIGE